jgi:antitoxin CptB
VTDTADCLIDERALSRLKWSCRRGLLENDLFIQRFFQTHEPHLSLRQARGLQHLMDLSDNDLLDLLLRRSELSPSMDRPEVREVLSQLRRPAPVSTSEGMTP